MAQLRITDGKGVHFTFDNGLTLSVQIGGGNYSENYEFPIGGITRDNPLQASSTAELALWNEKGEWMPIEDGNVKGYVPVSAIIRFIPFIVSLDADQTRETFATVYKTFSWDE